MDRLNQDKENLLAVVVKALDDKRAKDIVALDMAGLSIITDYNVVTHGSSSRQINALAQAVLDAASQAGFDVNRIEGKGSSSWVLIDLGEVVVHVFSEEERDFYQLESLWTEAPSVDIAEWISWWLTTKLLPNFTMT